MEKFNKKDFTFQKCGADEHGNPFWDTMFRGKKTKEIAYNTSCDGFAEKIDNLVFIMNDDDSWFKNTIKNYKLIKRHAPQFLKYFAEPYFCCEIDFADEGMAGKGGNYVLVQEYIKEDKRVCTANEALASVSFDHRVIVDGLDNMFDSSPLDWVIVRKGIPVFPDYGGNLPFWEKKMLMVLDR